MECKMDKQYTEPDDGGLILVLLVAVGVIGFVLGVAVGIGF